MGCTGSNEGEGEKCDVIGHELIPGGVITPGNYIFNGDYYFAVQDDGNLVVYRDSGEPIWAADTNGQSVKHLIMQDDGNLVLYGTDDQPLWASNTNGRGHSNRVAMQDDGNLVMYNRSGQAIWCTRTDGGQRSPFWKDGEILSIPSLMTDQHIYDGNAIDANGYFFAVQTDGNLVVYKDDGEPIWASNTNGQGCAPYDLRFQGDGNLVLYGADDGVVWASDTNDKGGVRCTMQDDGNFVMYNGDDAPVWCTRSDEGSRGDDGRAPEGAWGKGEMC